MLLAVVVGSGHMGETLAAGNLAVALLANALATGFGLWVLIEIFGHISGAHFNPLVTMAFAIDGDIRPRDAVAYIVVQVLFACAGVLLAHAMFDLPILQTGIKVRYGFGQWISEAVATAGLVFVIFQGRRKTKHLVPALVAAFIASAYWFTASTSFANPAVTIARSLTTTFAGILPTDVFGFIVAQVIGGTVGFALYRILRDSRNDCH